MTRSARTAPGPAVRHRRQTPLGLPPSVHACLFDLDGVLTRTTPLHEAAWKRMFDAYLRERARRGAAAFVPFGNADYLRYVDGRPRADGVRSFLAARGIRLPEGAPSDGPDMETVNGLGNRKNELVLSLIAEHGVETYEGSIRYVRAARVAGLRCAVVSSSANCRDVLRTAGILPLFDVVVDGVVAAGDRLRGKPAPDTFLRAASVLGVSAAVCAVFEDALAGVEAGRAGGFGFVVGVDRGGQAALLYARGADVVVSDLADLLEVT